MSDDHDREPSPAELFHRFFGPSIFIPWTRVLLDHADPRPGERVLDLACGTGIVARRVARFVGPEGEVAALDIDPDMLEVARSREDPVGASVEWTRGDAADLDFPDDSFDLVLCQQGLQFFEEPVPALSEARRVLRAGGRMVLNVWQPLERHPVYRALLEAEARYLESDLQDVATPFVFGDEERVRGVLSEAGFERVNVAEETLDVVFTDPETFVSLTVMAGAAVVPEVAMDDPEERDSLIEAIRRDGEDVLERYREGDALVFPMPNYVATAHA
ncbi:MAG: methyltransferase domain-containing protein [Longimicrobiales bacterium]|nr:methyltransferase domain-containing protein [Longimicrobiales bacterium]